MTTLLPNLHEPEPSCPTGDGEPVAETYDHFYALAIAFWLVQNNPLLEAEAE